MISFMRKSRKVEETLIIVANFANVKQEFEIGVPLEGKYTEIFNTDASRYGGGDRTKNKTLQTSDKEADDFPYSFQMTAAPLSLMVFSYESFTEEEYEKLSKDKEEQIKKRLAEEKEAVEKKALAEIKALEEKTANEKAAAKKRVKEEIALAEKKAASELSRLFKKTKKPSDGVEKLKAGKIIRKAPTRTKTAEVPAARPKKEKDKN
jgi:1,4-alpha-glucan branching enzyme